MVYLRKTELSQLHRKKNNINNVLKALALKSFQVQKTAIAKTKTKKIENKHFLGILNVYIYGLV